MKQSNQSVVITWSFPRLDVQHNMWVGKNRSDSTWNHSARAEWWHLCHHSARAPSVSNTTMNVSREFLHVQSRYHRKRILSQLDDTLRLIVHARIHEKSLLQLLLPTEVLHMLLVSSKKNNYRFWYVQMPLLAVVNLSSAQVTLLVKTAFKAFIARRSWAPSVHGPCCDVHRWNGRWKDEFFHREYDFCLRIVK